MSGELNGDEPIRLQGGSTINIEQEIKEEHLEVYKLVQTSLSLIAVVFQEINIDFEFTGRILIVNSDEMAALTESNINSAIYLPGPNVILINDSILHQKSKNLTEEFKQYSDFLDLCHITYVLLEEIFHAHSTSVEESLYIDKKVQKGKFLRSGIAYLRIQNDVFKSFKFNKPQSELFLGSGSINVPSLKVNKRNPFKFELDDQNELMSMLVNIFPFQMLIPKIATLTLPPELHQNVKSIIVHLNKQEKLYNLLFGENLFIALSSISKIDSRDIFNFIYAFYTEGLVIKQNLYQSDFGKFLKVLEVNRDFFNALQMKTNTFTASLDLFLDLISIVSLQKMNPRIEISFLLEIQSGKRDAGPSLSVAVKSYRGDPTFLAEF